MLFTFGNCTVTHGDRILFRPEWGSYDMGIGEIVTSAFAGPVDESYWPPSDFPDKKVPHTKNYSREDRELLDMYIKLDQARQSGNKEELLAVVDANTETLLRSYPDHWLLPWNMLELLVKNDCGITYACRLKDMMLEAERKRFHDIPVTMGLKYLNLL